MVAQVLPPERAVYHPSDSLFSEMKTYLDSLEALRMDHSDLERELNLRGNALIRQLLQDHLTVRSPGAIQGEAVDHEGTVHKQARPQTRQLETIFGTVTVDRYGYAAPGTDSLHPLDAALNLPEDSFSFGVRRRVAEEAAKGSFEEAAETVSRTTGAHVAKRQAEELTVRSAQDFEAFYALRRETALVKDPAGSILVVSFDRKGVVMRKEDLREPTRKAAEASQHKLQTRLSSGEKRKAKRMATVGAVYTVAPHPRKPEDIIGVLGEPSPKKGKPDRPKPEVKRVMASLMRIPEEVVKEIFDAAVHRDSKGTKDWVALVDGDPTLMRLIKKEAGQRKILVRTVIDFVHVTEYVWRAGTAFHQPGTKELEAWVHDRLRDILSGHASQVAAGMRRSATIRELPAEDRKVIDDCARYLLNRKLSLGYKWFLEKGYHIATGVIEGACRHLVKDRMDRTGARWSLTGAEAILRLRALISSGDFDEYWEFHEAQEKQRNHVARYRDGVIPDVLLPIRKGGPRISGS